MLYLAMRPTNYCHSIRILAHKHSQKTNANRMRYPFVSDKLKDNNRARFILPLVYCAYVWSNFERKKKKARPLSNCCVSMSLFESFTLCSSSTSFAAVARLISWRYRNHNKKSKFSCNRHSELISFPQPME